MADWTLRKQQRRYTIPWRDILNLNAPGKKLQKQTNKLAGKATNAKPVFRRALCYFFSSFRRMCNNLIKFTPPQYLTKR